MIVLIDLGDFIMRRVAHSFFSLIEARGGCNKRRLAAVREAFTRPLCS